MWYVDVLFSGGFLAELSGAPGGAVVHGVAQQGDEAVAVVVVEAVHFRGSGAVTGDTCFVQKRCRATLSRLLR